MIHLIILQIYKSILLYLYLIIELKQPKLLKKLQRNLVAQREAINTPIKVLTQRLEQSQYKMNKSELGIEKESISFYPSQDSKTTKTLEIKITLSFIKVVLKTFYISFMKLIKQKIN